LAFQTEMPLCLRQPQFDLRVCFGSQSLRMPVFVEPGPPPEHSAAINRSYLFLRIDN
jgi:hypothetical protein